MKKLKQKLNSDEGFVISVIYMMFLVIMLSLAGLSINVQNNAKYTDMSMASDSAYYYADFGMKKAQSKILEVVNAATKERKVEYAEDSENIIIDINPYLTGLFYDEIVSTENLVNLEVKVHKDTKYIEAARQYVIIVTSTVKDKSRGKYITSEAKLGARLAPSVKQNNPITGEIYVAMSELLFGSTVEVKKTHEYIEY